MQGKFRAIALQGKSGPQDQNFRLSGIIKQVALMLKIVIILKIKNS